MYHSTFSQLPKITLDYLEYGAPEGQRDDSAYKAAQQFKWNGYSQQEAMAAIVPRAMADGLSEAEARKCVRQGYESSKQGEPTSSGHGSRHPRRTDKPQRNYKRVKTEPEPIPEGMKRGDVGLLMAAFKEGEYVSIGTGSVTEDGIVVPDKGDVRTREEWLEIMKEKPFHESFNGAPSYFIRINPMKEGGTEDKDVTVFRHVLVEADKGTKEAQLGAIRKLGLPITAIIDSGNKSIHCWVRIDAKNRRNTTRKSRRFSSSASRH
jgi:hypothetical protein